MNIDVYFVHGIYRNAGKRVGLGVKMFEIVEDQHYRLKRAMACMHTLLRLTQVKWRRMLGEYLCICVWYLQKLRGKGFGLDVKKFEIVEFSKGI